MILKYLNDVDPDDTVAILDSFETQMRFSEEFDEKCHVLITEFIQGGDMLDRLNKEIIKYAKVTEKKFIPNLQTKVEYIKQLLSFTAFLHSHKISHMDITLENILLRDDKPILIDYGLAEIKKNWNTSKLSCKPYYVSPEIVNDESYDPRKRDTWCIGLCFYSLISHRYLIFNPNHMKSILSLLDNGFSNYVDTCKIDTSYWPDEVIDFVSLCLKSNQEDRPLPADLLNHVMFTKHYENVIENTDVNEVQSKLGLLEKRTKSNNKISTFFDLFKL